MKFVTSELIEQLDFKHVVFIMFMYNILTVEQCEQNVAHSHKAITALSHCAEGKVKLALLGNFAHRLERP